MNSVVFLIVELLWCFDHDDNDDYDDDSFILRRDIGTLARVLTRQHFFLDLLVRAWWIHYHLTEWMQRFERGENHSQNPGLYKSRAQDGVEAVIKT